jgi:hypothetical protein
VASLARAAYDLGKRVVDLEAEVAEAQRKQGQMQQLRRMLKRRG